MAGIRLDHSYSFGLNINVASPVEYLDDTDCVYICGHSLIKLDADAKTQSCVPCTPGALGVTALAVTQTKRLTAYAEIYKDSGPTITVYDWNARGKRIRKVIGGLDLGSDRIVSLHFTADNKHLLIQSGAPEWTITYLLWEKSRVIAQYRTLTPDGSPVHQTDTHPIDPTVILASGQGFFRMFRLADDALKPLVVNLKQEPRNFLCHAWLPEDRLVTGTDAGELLIFEGTEFRKLLDTSPNDGQPIDSLIAFSKGFVAGCDGGRIRIYERSEDARLFYKLTAEFAVVGDESRVIHLAVSANEENLVAVLSSGQSYEFRLSNYELFKTDDIVFRPLVTAFHAAGPDGDRSVTGLDICMRKPLFVTCGADHTVRLWNFSQHLGPQSAVPAETQPTLELVKRFREPAYSISFHPSGLHVVVGFESTLQLMNVLMDDIRPIRDFAMRRVNAVQFSHGGQFFAAATGTTITVFETYTGVASKTMRGHHGKVTSLSWTRDDCYLVSVGEDGMLHRWDVSTGKSRNRVEALQCAYSCVDATHVGDASGSDALVVGSNTQHDQYHIFQQIGLQSNPRAPPKADVKTDGLLFTSVTGLSGDRGVIIATGTPNKPGIIRIYGAPLADYTPSVPGSSSGYGIGSNLGGTPNAAVTPPNSTNVSATLSQTLHGTTASTGNVFGAAGAAAAANAAAQRATVPFTEVICHGAPITKMALTWDEGLLITAAEDGTVVLHHPIDVRGGRRNSAINSTTGGAYGTTAVSNADNALAASGPGALAVTAGAGMPFAEEILVTRAALEGSRTRKQKLEAAVAELKVQNEYNLQYKKMSQEEKMTEVEQKFHQELDQERERHDELQQAKATAETKFDSQIGDMEEAHARDLQELEASYKSKIQAEIERFDALVAERDRRAREWQHELQELSERHEAHIQDLKEEYEKAIQEESDATTALADERRQLKTDISGRQDTLENDADLEMDTMRTKYETRLANEKKATLMLMGENGMMKRKYDTLLEKKTAQRVKVQEMLDREKDLYDHISSLQKDVQGHKKEIREREETINEKDGRIFDLRKKNQELEKFKFVLNYKIQELKRQIMPRKREIIDMREQMKEMELELLQYHKSNAALLLMISELKLKKRGMEGDNDTAATELASKVTILDGIRRDLMTVRKSLDDYHALKEEVTQLYHRYIHGDTTAFQVGKRSSMDTADLQTEYGRQRAYLEKSVTGIERKLVKDVNASRKDRQRLMRENTMLTKEINELRRDIQFMKMERKAEDNGSQSTYGVHKSTLESTGLARTSARFGVFGDEMNDTQSVNGGKHAEIGLTQGLRGTFAGRASRFSVSQTPAEHEISEGKDRTLGMGAGATRDIEKQYKKILTVKQQLEHLQAVVAADPSLGQTVLEESPYAMKIKEGLTYVESHFKRFSRPDSNNHTRRRPSIGSRSGTSTSRFPPISRTRD